MHRALLDGIGVWLREKQLGFDTDCADRKAGQRPSARHCRRACRGAMGHREPASTVCGCGCQMQRIGEELAEKVDARRFFLDLGKLCFKCSELWH